MATQITIILEVSPEDADPNDETGLTDEAFTRLTNTLSSEGYTFVAGPDRVSK